MIYLFYLMINMYSFDIYDMIWWDEIWWDMTWWDDMMRWDMIWWDEIWYDEMIWDMMRWYDEMIWFDLIWFDETIIKLCGGRNYSVKFKIHHIADLLKHFLILSQFSMIYLQYQYLIDPNISHPTKGGCLLYLSSFY